jgi:RHS repeat-associated protein
VADQVLSLVVTTYNYEPFGNATSSGASSTNSFQYTGRENDTTGLDYLRARYYSPPLQRFLSEDPLGFAGGDVNLYAYVSDQPLAFVDPLGLCGFSFGGLLNAMVGRCNPFDPIEHFVEKNIGPCLIGAGTGALEGPVGAAVGCVTGVALDYGEHSSHAYVRYPSYGLDIVLTARDLGHLDEALRELRQPPPRVCVILMISCG